MMRFGLVVMALLALASCNTVAGLGEDVTAGARRVQGVF